MPRTVKEWIGKDDDARPTQAAKRRILDRGEPVSGRTGRAGMEQVEIEETGR